MLTTRTGQILLKNLLRVRKINIPYSLIKSAAYNKQETFLRVLCAIKQCDVPAGFGSQFRFAPISEVVKISNVSRQTVKLAIDHYVDLGFIRRVKGKNAIYALQSNRKIHSQIIEQHPSWESDCESPGGGKVKMIQYEPEHFDTFSPKDLFFATYLQEEALRQCNGRRHRLRTRRKANLPQQLSFQLALRTIADRLNMHYVTASRKLHRLARVGLLSIDHDIKVIPWSPGLRCEHLHGLYQSSHKQRIFVPSPAGFTGWGPNSYSIELIHRRVWARVA